MPSFPSETALHTPLELRQGVADAARAMHAQGWTPATSSNFSAYLPGHSSFAISVSGLDKGTLTAHDFLEVDFNGQPVHTPNTSHDQVHPSAETLLHAAIYQQFPRMQAVLHSHSVNATVLSKLYEAQKGIPLQNFEILKAFAGVKTHEAELWLPIFPNSQDIPVLVGQIGPSLLKFQPTPGFLLAGHGLYTWGASPTEALRHAQAFEFLFEAILKLRSYGYADYSR
jgi:methylthioribulose-1-phosphate dehydratase